MKMKTCNCIKSKILPLTDFSKVGKYYHGQCKKCRAEEARTKVKKEGRGKGRFNANGAARIDDNLYDDVMRLLR